jgi:2-methylcitrate dehydratase
MDGTIRTIVEFAADLGVSDISESAHEALIRHHLDSIGCALGGFHGEPSAIARRIAMSAPTPNGASVIGLAEKSSLECATFANACMVRYLDFNDGYFTTGGGHPSDFIPAILAAAEHHHVGAEGVLLGMHTGYEVFVALADALPMRERGWDNGAFEEIAAAVGVAKVLGLGPTQMANAIALAITPNLPLGVTRTGQLSHWKGCAGPYGTMAGLFAARLAAEGLTGPAEAIEGVRGLWDLATGPFSLARIGVPLDGLSAVERTCFKLYIADGVSQGPVHEFVQLAKSGVRPEDIGSITISTHFVAWSETGGGQDDHDEKWDPKTKETADHSLPYMAAVALSDSALTAESYAPARLADPSLRPLMQKISVVVDPELSKHWEARPAHHIEVALTDGTRRRIECDYPKGHPRNPMTDTELEEKFLTNAQAALDDRRAAALLETLWCFAELEDVENVMSMLRAV